MQKPTEELIKIFKECKIRHQVDKSFSEDTDVVCVRMKHNENYTDFAIFIADNSTEASIQAIIGKTTPKMRPVCLEILNELNGKHKWIKYAIDNKNLICAQIDVIAKDNILPSLVFQLLCNALDFVIQTKNTLSENSIIICTNKKEESV